MRTTRRTVMRLGVGGALAATVPCRRAWAASSAASQAGADARSHLAKCIYTRQEVDDWFAGRRYPFAKYDAELGWLLKNARFADGVDGSTSTYTYGKYDERRMIAHADQPCRINTYGDSFTQCHQVNEGETWQEVLARHLHEPIRNFGVGAYSVYQAYLRMLREEQRVPAKCIIFNIYDDDHYRNLDAWRQIRSRKDERFICPTLPHLKVDLKAGACSKEPNPCPTREEIYHLCDLDWVEKRFRDDFVLNLMLAHARAREGNPHRAYQSIMDLARTHGINTNVDSMETFSSAANTLHARAALLATQQVVEWVEDFARRNDKKVLYVLSFNALTIARRVREGTRFDRPFVEFLEERKLPYVDLMQAHLKEFATFKVGIDDYLKRYYIGHYNPQGNFFAAFAIKNKLVGMLDPKPSAYLPP